jgi:hypothetical protein
VSSWALVRFHGIGILAYWLFFLLMLLGLLYGYLKDKFR